MLRKARNSPESIWLQRRRIRWRWGSWGWAGSVCRKPLSKRALCPCEWPADGKAQWLPPQTRYLETESHSYSVRHGPVKCSSCTSESHTGCALWGSYLFQCLQSWGWRPSRRSSHRCWWQWKARSLNQDHNPFGAAHRAAARSAQQQTAEEEQTLRNEFTSFGKSKWSIPTI